MLPFAERTTFTGAYRNEARSEMFFLSAGMFTVQVVRGCGGRDIVKGSHWYLYLKPL